MGITQTRDSCDNANNTGTVCTSLFKQYSTERPTTYEPSTRHLKMALFLQDRVFRIVVLAPTVQAGSGTFLLLRHACRTKPDRTDPLHPPHSSALLRKAAANTVLDTHLHITLHGRQAPEKVGDSASLTAHGRWQYACTPAGVPLSTR